MANATLRYQQALFIFCDFSLVTVSLIFHILRLVVFYDLEDREITNLSIITLYIWADTFPPIT
jgi:hypothetical protein